MTTLAYPETFRTTSANNPALRKKVLDGASYFGVHVAAYPVCPGHTDPLTFLTAWVYDRPDLSVVLGPRGGGKSYLSALDTHISSLRFKRHGTRVLGGSLAQSQQIYHALIDFDRSQPGGFTHTKETATYRNGSDVSILTASEKSVRGPHVPSLKLDEIDEIDPSVRDASVGMCMSRPGDPRASIAMTSTWHKIGGPMADLMDRAAEGQFPLWTFCVFEVLERCPEERSGPNLERCPACPLVRWCHDTADGVPKAKRSAGHYPIDSLIQKAKTVSLRVFEADYLCSGPKADGLWFTQFDEARHVSGAAEYEPHLPVHLAVDSGVFTGAVFYQVRGVPGGHTHVNVFADYLSENVTAENNARALLRLADQLCNGNVDYRHTDPAGGARNPVGKSVIDIYAAAGLPLDRWPQGSVADGLALVDGCLLSADGTQSLWIHPRCRYLIKAFRGYDRAKRAGQWMDYPKDPQHPHEDLMDALRGGLVAEARGSGAGWGPNPFR